MSPGKVYTAFYAYYATRGGVCTLRRGARAARGCAGGPVCVACSSPSGAMARRVWCGGDKDRLTSQSHGVQSQQPTPSASSCRRTSCASGKQKMCLSAHLRVLETRVVSQGKPLCLQRYTAVTHDQHVLRHMSGSGHRGCVLIPFVSWDTPLCLMTVAMSQDGLVCLETTQCLGTSLSVS